MKVVGLCLFACLAVAAAAPAILESEAQAQPESHRVKRSHYASPSYGSPCSAPISYAPAPAYQIAQSPIHAYAIPQHYSSYGSPHYREEDEEMMGMNMMGFHDMEHGMTEHMPMARSYGGYGGHAPAGPGPILAGPAPSGPAIGVFPNANVGNCAVPLLLSCSPSIVSGKIVSKPSYGPAYGGASYGSGASGSIDLSSIASGSSNSYRGVESGSEHADTHEQRATHEPLAAHETAPDNTAHTN